MPLCDGAHRQFDGLRPGSVQVGELPEWTRVGGRVAWSVARGPYDALGSAWAAFHAAVGAARPGVPNGPPGEVFVCRPEDHAADGGDGILTILYLPIA